MSLEQARVVADAVLYEGYLLYPYRATSGKNQARWQFGVLGPQGAAAAGIGEDASMNTQLLVRGQDAVVTVRLRFLHLQARTVHRLVASGEFEPVPELAAGTRRWLTWDEAVERNLEPATVRVPEFDELFLDLLVPGGCDEEELRDDDGSVVGRLIRARERLQIGVALQGERLTADLAKLSISIDNDSTASEQTAAAAIAASLIGTHLLLSVEGGEFVSMTDPAGAEDAAAGCRQHRCWPVLAGPEGDRSLVLVSPIILPDHPEVAEQSAGALFDSTEIDEILTLRVMTMTDEEKAVARATDAKAAEIIDRCDAMSPEAMQQLHGILRDPHATGAAQPEVPWWDPAVDSSVSPYTDTVPVSGVQVGAGSVVRLHPNRRADAHDMFFADQLARVSAVHTDVDGEIHVAVVLLDDPAAEMHDWYGRYLHFAPDELEPMPDEPAPQLDNREELRPWRR